ncbi:hypothetical protein Dimus_000779 [Dionaea muscipula]
MVPSPPVDGLTSVAAGLMGLESKLSQKPLSMLLLWGTKVFTMMITIAVSVAYLIYDLLCCQFDVKPNLDNSIHHVVSIAGLCAGLAYQEYGSEMVATLWITELSSPFLHLRELLKELDYKGTDLNLAADTIS